MHDGSANETELEIRATPLDTPPLPNEAGQSTAAPQPITYHASYGWRLRYGRTDRWLIAGLGTGLLVMLVMAFILTPSSEGLGTHQKLGLPPCTTRVLLGVRCPGCGMTTSWAYFTKGQLQSALQANAGGVILCLAALLSVPMTALISYRGVGSYYGWYGKTGIALAIIAIVISIAEWIWRLMSTL